MIFPVSNVNVEMECLMFDISKQVMAVAAEICTQNKAQCSHILRWFSRLFAGTETLDNFKNFEHY